MSAHAQDATEGHRVRVSVSDFGPIAKADVELRPLTIFVGPSNTGKSYFATLLYALSKCVSGRHWMRGGVSSRLFGRSRRPLGHYRLHEEAWKQLSKEAKEGFAAWTKENLADAPDAPEFVSPFPRPLQDGIKAAHEEYWKLHSNVEFFLKQSFGMDDTHALKRNGSKKFPVLGISIGEARGGPETRLAVSLVPEKTSAALDISPEFDLTPAKKLLPRLMGYGDLLRQGTIGKGAADEEVLRFMLDELCLMESSPLSQLARFTHYLPADRTGIMHAHKVVVGALVQGSTYGGIHPHHTPLLSGVLGDFLQELIEMPPTKGPFHSLGKAIESEMLDGELHVERAPGSGYPNFLYQPNKWGHKEKIELMHASSMVSELAPIALSLRHTVGKGDLVIIEEPEAHLHPAKQAELAFHLAKLVRRGLRVVVTTHSEWVLEKFANLVGTSRLTREQRAKMAKWHANIEGASLRSDQVGAWLFNPSTRPKGSVVREIPLDMGSGTFPTNFRDVSHQLYEEWGHIYRWVNGRAA